MDNVYSMTQGEADTIDNLMPGNQLTRLGGKLKQMFDITAGTGKVFFIDPANGNDTNDGKSYWTAFKTMTVAYAALTANQNDVLFLIGDASGLNLSAQLVWAKSYTHLIGICAPVGVGNRARIFQLSTATGISPLISITASGCIFKNLYIFHGVDDATSLVCVQVSGQRNYFENVHFAGIGHATMDTTGAASLKIAAGAENLFKHCFIGLDTIPRGANSTELWLTSAATRNIFEDCMIYGYISNAGHALVTVGALGIDRYLKFDNCLFYTDSENQAVTGTSVFSLPAMTQGKILLDALCRMVTDGASGSGEWDSNNRGLVWSAAVAPAAAAAGGISTKQ